jgi:hypothetical protein
MTDHTPATAATFDTLGDLLAGLQSAQQTTRPVQVHVPQMGGSLWVKPLDAAEWLDPGAGPQPPDTATPAQVRGWGIARWVSDAQGQRLISPDNLAALDLFAALPWGVARSILVASGAMHEGKPKNG